MTENNEYIFSEGVGWASFSEFDQALFVSSIFFILLITLIISRIKIFSLFNFYFNTESKKEILFNSEFFENTITLCFIIFSLFLSFINFKYNIFQKGTLISGQFNYIFILIIKWFFQIGFISIISIFLFNKINRSYDNFFLLLLIFLVLIFAYNVSLLSRALILDFAAIFLGIFTLYKEKLLSEKLKLFIIVVVSFFLFISSLIIINEIRLDKNVLQTNKKINIETTNARKNFHLNELRVLIFNRFVGIDSLINVIKSDKLSFTLLKDSIDYKMENKGFYENNFLIQHKKNNKDQIKNHNIIVPGIVAYLYYSGSIFIMTILFTIIYLFMIFFEFLTLKFSNNNLIMASVIGNILAYRLIHFGYMPLNSYQFILGIIFAICIYPILKYLFKIYV